MIRKIILLVAMTALVTPYTASAMIDLNRYSQKLYKPVAMVENHTITEVDIEQKMAIMQMSGIELTRAEVLEHLISQEAILYIYRDRPLSQEAINFTIQKLSAENGMSDIEFNSLLKKFSIEREYLKRHIAAHMILNEMIAERIKVIPESQRALFQKSQATINEINRTDTILLNPIIEYIFNKQSQVKIAEIVVKPGKNFQSIVELLRQGKTFDFIRNKFPSEVELSTQDGVIGWVNFSDMTDLYKDIIKNIKINQIGEPLVANNNYLFIKLLDIKNVDQSKRLLNPQYINLTFKEKTTQLYNGKIANLISHSIIQQLRQQLYIELL
jgi:parvulin-like peptidyl-prolyl isomerase